MIYLELAVGLVLLLAGGEFLVRGSIGVATRLGVSPLMIGLTLVAFGTSTPELVTSIEAALVGAPGIAIGNIVGSNIANIFLILGISAVIFPLTISRKALRRDGTVVIVASLLLVSVALLGNLDRAAGLVFVALLGCYTVYTYLAERRLGQITVESGEGQSAELDVQGISWSRGLLLTISGIAGVVWGASLLVGASVEIARAIGLSEAVIGLTLVAVGTSLPELITSVVAAIRRHADIAFGNVVGSNIFNILGIGGATAIVSPISVPSEIATLDVWVALAAALMLVVFAATNRQLSRAEGAIFLTLYAAYLSAQLIPGVRSVLGLA